MRAPLVPDPGPIPPERPLRIRRRSSPRFRDPLTLWRTTDRARISRADVGRLARRLAVTEILHERRWPRARAGDAAAATAIAIDHLRGLREANRISDLVLGNLVVLAMRGDATAPVILAHALRTIGRFDPTNPALLRLADCWSRGVPRHPRRLRPSASPARVRRR